MLGLCQQFKKEVGVLVKEICISSLSKDAFTYTLKTFSVVIFFDFCYVSVQIASVTGRQRKNYRMRTKSAYRLKSAYHMHTPNFRIIRANVIYYRT